MTLKELTDRLAAISARGKEFVAACASAPMTDEQEAELARLEAEKLDIERKIRAVKFTESVDATLASPAPRGGQPLQPGGGSPAAGAPATRIEVGATRVDLDPMVGFGSYGDFLSSVRAAQTGGGIDKRLLPVVGAESERAGMYAITSSDYAREGVGAEGGFLVPPQMRADVWNAIEDNPASLFNLLYNEPISGASVKFDADETTPWGAAGIRPYWIAEGGTPTITKPAVKKRENELHKLGALVNVTEELLADAPRLNNVITKQAGAGMEFEISQAYWNGNGVGRPLGFFGHASQVSVAKETSQTAATVNISNISKMVARRRSVRSAKWMWLVHPSVIPQIIELKIGDTPIFTNANTGGRDEVSTAKLMGYPLYECEHCEVLGTKGDIILANANGYYGIRHTTGMRADMSIHVYFTQDINAFRWIARVGGMPFLASYITPKNGSLYYSDFISLDTRS